MNENKSPQSYAIFGAGKCGGIAFRVLNGHCRITAHIDNDLRKQGSEYHSLKVLQPKALAEDPDCSIIIAVNYPYPIVEQMQKMNL